MQSFSIDLGGGFDLRIDPHPAPAQADIFHRRNFYDLHQRRNDGAGTYFQVVERGTGEIAGAIHFCETSPGVYRSPLRGSYGGLAMASELRSTLITHIYAAIEAALLEDGATMLEVVLPPAAYGYDAFAWEFQSLQAAGFLVARCELNSAIPVGAPRFRDVLRREKRKKLNKSARRGLVTRHIEANEMAEAYQVIAESRRDSPHQLSMTWEQVEEMLNTFPAEVFGVAGFDGARMVASSIAIRVNPDVIYAFYYGDRAGFESETPVVAVMECLYETCVGERKMLLDLGTSSIDGVPNEGLISFKQSLGATLSPKVAFVKNLV